ncbi:MAG TPA: DUF1028 domain-containing protein [Solirubrobacteraceae bacterium]|jgi:uncharacterized Ntn-hydrolase superfamily protein
MAMLAHRAGTYSIVARDPETGQFGVAVQSHWFSVGALVPWALPGVGAVATQANVDVSYGPHALELLAAGVGANEALARLVARDAGAATRQVAAVDSRGEVAAHTGSLCVPFAGHVSGEACSCQGNLLASADVWPAMLDAFRESSGPLARSLLGALDAGESAGGDARGRQSAALLVVGSSGEPWEEVVSLRVEDHPAPLVELRRLLELHDAYALADSADGLVGEGRHAEAAQLYERASAQVPDSHELAFWSGLGLAQSGQMEAGLARVRQAIELHPGWRKILERLPAEMAPAGEAVRERLKTYSADADR